MGKLYKNWKVIVGILVVLFIIGIFAGENPQPAEEKTSINVDTLNEQKEETKNVSDELKKEVVNAEQPTTDEEVTVDKQVIKNEEESIKSNTEKLWEVLCDATSTELRIKNTFSKYKNQINEFVGYVYDVPSEGNLIEVRHCNYGSIADRNVILLLKEDAIDEDELAMLEFNDKIKYRANLTDGTILFGKVLITARDGELIK